MTTGATYLSIASLVRSIESVESELGTALTSKQAALEAKHAALNQLADVKDAAHKREVEMAERLAALQREAEQAQAQVKSSEVDKQKIAEQLAGQSAQLQLLLSRRDSNYKDLKERHCTAQQELLLLRDELARLQSKAASQTAVMVALEAELSKSSSTLSQVRDAVADNRSLVSAHEEKVQGLMIKEEAVLRKLNKQAATIKALRLAIEEQQRGMQEQAVLLREARNNLVKREQAIKPLQLEVKVLQADNAEHVASKNTILEHLQESNRLLHESRKSSEQHRVALDQLRHELRDLKAHTAAFMDEAPCQEVGGLPNRTLQRQRAGRSPLSAQAEGQISVMTSMPADTPAGSASASMPMLPAASGEPLGSQVPVPPEGLAPECDTGGGQPIAIASAAPGPAQAPQQSASTAPARPAASSSNSKPHDAQLRMPCTSIAAGNLAAAAGTADMLFSLAADTPDELEVDSSPPQAAASANKSSTWHRPGHLPPKPERPTQRDTIISLGSLEGASLQQTAVIGGAEVVDPNAKEKPLAAKSTSCQTPDTPRTDDAAAPAPGVIIGKDNASSEDDQVPQEPRDLFASFAAFETPPSDDGGALSGKGPNSFPM